MEKHVVLVIEGGGAKMPLETAQIEYIEETLNKPITEIADLAVTTSSQQEEITEKRDIIIGFDGRSTRRTMGAGAKQ